MESIVVSLDKKICETVDTHVTVDKVAIFSTCTINDFELESYECYHLPMVF